jgi:hypothetical protein
MSRRRKVFGEWSQAGGLDPADPVGYHDCCSGRDRGIGSIQPHVDARTVRADETHRMTVGLASSQHRGATAPR